MGKIVIKKQTEPTTPDTGDVSLYIDSADGKVKYKEEGGSVESVASESYIDSIIYSGLSDDTLVAGESISTGDSLYISSIDGKLYKTDASDTSKLPKNPLFSKGNYSIDDEVLFDFSGITKTKTGLTTGDEYYLSDTAGAISTTPGTYPFGVGVGSPNGNLRITEVMSPSFDSGDVYYTLYGERTANSSSYVEIDSLTVLQDGLYTLTYRTYAQISGGAGSVSGYITLNGTQFGDTVTISTSSTAYSNYKYYTIPLKAGDELKLYLLKNDADIPVGRGYGYIYGRPL